MGHPHRESWQGCGWGVVVISQISSATINAFQTCQFPFPTSPYPSFLRLVLTCVTSFSFHEVNILNSSFGDEVGDKELSRRNLK